MDFDQLLPLLDSCRPTSAELCPVSDQRWPMLTIIRPTLAKASVANSDCGVLPACCQSWPNLAKAWPKSCRLRRICAESQVPEPFLDTCGAVVGQHRRGDHEGQETTGGMSRLVGSCRVACTFLLQPAFAGPPTSRRLPSRSLLSRCRSRRVSCLGGIGCAVWNIEAGRQALSRRVRDGVTVFL